MVIIDELPFRFMERYGFKNFMHTACPRFKIPSRWTISWDCYEMYTSERVKLKTFIKSQCERISITSDSWTSIQRINYMCMTTHFVNKGWNLHKK